MQLRFATSVTGEEYVSQELWLDASLPRCPLHPKGGCGFARHGTYERRSPPGTLIARWYCPQGHRTFSLLPDCLASRLPGTLAEVEAVVAAVEQAKSLEAAADRVRTDDISLPGAIRWTRRRIQQVHITLRILLDLIPECFYGCQPTVTAFRQWLNVDWVLPQLREIAAGHLAGLPSPLGFAPRPPHNADLAGQTQHDKGPDPPPTVC